MPRSMFHELLLLGYRLSVITFCLSFISLFLILITMPPNEDHALLAAAPLGQSIIGLIVCRAGMQIFCDQATNDPHHSQNDTA